MTEDFLGAMESAQQQEARRSAPIPAPAGDWFQWRKRNPDIGIGKTGEDGSLSDWQDLLRSEGSDRLTSAVIEARSTGRKGDRIWFSAVLTALGSQTADNSASDGKSDPEAAKRSKTDLLILSLILGPNCYADARCQWKDGEGTSERVVRYGGAATTFTIRERVCVQGTSGWEKMRDKARVAQEFIFGELGWPIDERHKPDAYKRVSESPQWRAWLCAHQLIAQ